MTVTTTDAPPPLSREEVLRVLRDSPEPMTKRDLARAFRVKGHDRTELKRVLRELENEGLLERGRGRRLRNRVHLPEVAVLEVIGPDEDGDLLARPVRREDVAEEEDEAEPPRVLLPGEQLGRWAPAPGDRVLARLRRVEDGYEGRVMRVLPSVPSRVLGVLEAAGDGLRLRPLDRGSRQEFRVGPAEAKGAGPGEVVAADVQSRGRRGTGAGLPRATVVERLGDSRDPRAISLMAAQAHGLPIDFPPEALAQAEAAAPVALEDGRADLRDLPLVTIDGPDARDFDDAVHALPDDDPKNRGGWQIAVAIADVAHYVRPGDTLDREAYRRGNSAYFPDRAIPMLPEALSNGLCSLRPDEDRACLVVRMWLDADGNKLRHRFARGLMRSRARLTYERVQAAADGAPDDATAPLMDSVIGPLYGAYRALDKARRRRGTLDLDLPERQVVLDEATGRPVAIRARQRLDSHRLIEEFMILANVAAAETLERAGIPLLYRVHDKPDSLKVEALAQLLDALGIQWGKGGLGRPRDFARLLARVGDHELAAMISEAVLRAQSQAVYSPRNLGHFGLNLGRYAHFTSPIRRYADLVVHRALIRSLKLGAGGLPEGTTVDELHEVGAAISKAERRAMAAERSAVSRYTAMLMADRVGAVFEARISGVQRFGVFVTLDESGADGFIPVSTLGSDFFRFDAMNQALVGESWGEAFGLGDRLKVELVEADIATGGLLFRLVEHTPGPTARLAAKGSKRKGGKRPAGGGARPRAARPKDRRTRRAG